MSDDLCRGCRAQIRWVTTEAGKAMPVDLAVTTTQDDRVVLYGDDGIRIIGTPSASRTGHEPHWSTCPVQAQFRRQSGKRANA